MSVVVLYNLLLGVYHYINVIYYNIITCKNLAYKILKNVTLLIKYVLQ